MLCVITHLILTTIWCSGNSYCLHFTLRLREFKCLIRYHNQPRRVKVQPGAGAGAVPQVQRTVRDADPALWLGGFPAWYPAGIHHCSGNGSKTPPWRSCKVRPAYSPVSIPSTFPSSSGPIHMVLLVSRLSVLHSAQGLCTSCPHCLECFYHLFSSLGTSSSVLSLTSLIGKKSHHVFSRKHEPFLSGAYHDFTLVGLFGRYWCSPVPPGDCELWVQEQVCLGSPWCPAQFLAHSKCSVNIRGMTEWMNADRFMRLIWMFIIACSGLSIPIRYWGDSWALCKGHRICHWTICVCMLAGTAHHPQPQCPHLWNRDDTFSEGYFESWHRIFT